jgi:predicted 2-oxoglutarate/Fe(II)-dependent dioxygenase YbiX
LRTRRTLTVDPPPDDVAWIERALDDVHGDLEQHFQMKLTGRELTDYLVYGPGAFFRAHRDRPNARGRSGSDIERQVSVVVFLSQSVGGTNPDYAGGELRFYRLLDGPEWRDIGFACDATQGMLVAFRADTLHEVAPVTAGRRCTLVTWFGGRRGLGAPALASIDREK